MKKKKEVKSKKQWPRWKAPFQPGSNIYKFVQAMMKRGGMPVKDFTRLIKKTQANPAFILNTIRKGHTGGWTWDFDDSRDRYRVTNVKLTVKK